jgi:hypothetical protein
MNPETPSDIRLILAALSQEISTLMLHFDPRHRRARAHADSGQLRQRLHLLIDHRRLFEQQLHTVLSGSPVQRLNPAG